MAAGVIDAGEERERLSRDPNSGYEGVSLEEALPALQGDDMDDDERKKLGLAALLEKASIGDDGGEEEGNAGSEAQHKAMPDE